MALKIPLVVTLWENRNFKGRRRDIVLEEDKSINEMIGVGNLTEFSFNNAAKSMVVERGPDYFTLINNKKEARVVLYPDIDFNGTPSEYPVGAYPSIPKNTSSLKGRYEIIPPPANPPQPSAIHLVLDLFDKKNLDGRRLTLVESSTHLGAIYHFNNLASSARLRSGPNYKPGDKVKLYKNINFDGPAQILELDDASNEQMHVYNDLDNMGNIISSVEFKL